MKIKETAKNLIILALSLILSITVIETMLHFINPESSMYIEGGDSVYRLKPDYDKVKRSINSHGFRNPEFTIEKPHGKKRILFIGDSFTFGATSSEQSFPRQFETMIHADSPDYEVINGGVPAYSTVHEYYFLKDHCAELDADLVVLAVFVGNDIEENAVFADVEREGSYLISTRMRSPKKGIQKLIAILHHSKIINLIQNRFLSYERLIDRNTDQLVHNVLRKYMEWQKNGIFREGDLYYNLAGFYNSLQGKKCDAQCSEKIKSIIQTWLTTHITDEEAFNELKNILIEGLSEQEQSARGYSRSVYLAIQLKHTEIYYKNTLEKGWKGTAGALEKIKDLCNERNQKLAVVIIPDETQLRLWLQQEVLRYNLDRPEQPDFELPQQKLKVVLNDLDIDHVDILPAFKEVRGSFYLKYNTHCNKNGNEIIAQAVYDLLKEVK